ncbi:MAG: FprA family A-type flavoprotein [Clostridiales bacterium]|nr:FprA family A-type flavoprotein [Clostridiales bacterium]
MGAKKLTECFWWVGTLDPGLRVFDIVMHTEYGTSYNSYLLKGDKKNVLFETSKAEFIDEYIETIEEVLPIKDIDILVLDHTEPDHAGSVERLLELNPALKVYATAGGLNLVKEIVNRDMDCVIVKDGDKLDIGGRTLHFITAPNLHWPDSMFTYIPEEKTLVTCDAFGAHCAYKKIVYDGRIDKERHLQEARYYFDNIMGPFKDDVLKAVGKIDGLEIDIIATGHGPALTGNPRFMVDLYREWASAQGEKENKLAVIPYVSAYGYTKALAETIAEGIKSAGDLDVELYDMVYTETADVLKVIERADGFLLGTPTLVGEALPPIWDIAVSLNARVHGGRFAGAFGSYGWSGEGVPHIMDRLKQLKLKIVGEGLRVRFKPTEEDLARAFEFGKVFGTAILTGAVPE